jgi:transposase
VTAQRRVNGQRGVKTDRVDLAAMGDLLLAGRGVPVAIAGAALVELAAWVAHRRRRVQIRTATKNQLLGQLDRAFPGLTLAVRDVLGSKVGRLVAAECADQARLAQLGVERFRGFAARRGVRVTRPVAGRLVTAARPRCPPPRPAWPARCWPPTWPCWPTWRRRSAPPTSGSPGCCRPPSTPC